MIPFDQLCRFNITVSATAGASSTAGGANEQTFTVPGLLTTDIIMTVSRPSTTDTYTIDNYRVSATSTIAITYSQSSTAPPTPTTSQSLTIVALRLGDASSTRSTTALIFNRM
jgi:hypothetical protein